MNFGYHRKAVLAMYLGLMMVCVQGWADSEIEDYENFEQMPTGWYEVNYWGADDSFWEISQEPLLQREAIVVNSFNAGFQLLDEQVVTKSYNFSDYSHVSVEFDHLFDCWDDEQGDFEVQVGEGANWETVSSYYGAGKQFFGREVFDLSQIVAKRQQIRFRWHYYNAFWASYWAVDNFTIRGIKTTDNSTCMIRGIVTTVSCAPDANPEPYPGVMVQACDLSGQLITGLECVTDENGFYEIPVEFGWSGSIRVVADDQIYTFTSLENGQITCHNHDSTEEDYVNFVGNIQLVELTGKARWGNGDVIQDLTIFRDEQEVLDDEVTWFNGQFRLQVPCGWEGSLRIYKEGYSFETDTIHVGPVYEATPLSDFICSNRMISGRITERFSDGLTVGERGVAQVPVYASNGATSGLTDSQGYYQVIVYNQWQGKIWPDKEGLCFMPAIREFLDEVISDLDGNDFIAGNETITLSGQIRRHADGAPVINARVLADNDDAIIKAFSDSRGRFQLKVPFGWSGDLYVEHNDYAFAGLNDPSQWCYTIEKAHYNEVFGFLATGDCYISGTVSKRDVGRPSGPLAISGVRISSDTLQYKGITDESGAYFIRVPYNWCGSVTAEKDNYQFEPLSQESGPIIDGSVQCSFIGEEPSYQISGYVYDFMNRPVGDVLVYVNEQANLQARTTENGYYSIDIPSDGLKQYIILAVKNEYEFALDSQANAFYYNDCHYSPVNFKQTVWEITDGESFQMVVNNAVSDGLATVVLKNDISLDSEIIIPAGTDWIIFGEDDGKRKKIDCRGQSRLFTIGGSSTENDYRVKFVGLEIENGNAANDGGAIISNDPKLSLELIDITFINNQSQGDGGALYLQNAKLKMQYCEFYDNCSQGKGGAVFLWDLTGVTNINHCIFTGNGSVDNDGENDAGGGIYLRQLDDEIRFQHCQFSGNYGADGGALFATNSQSIIGTDLDIIGNIANGKGGGVCTSSTDLKLISSSIHGNQAILGGGCYVRGTGSIDCYNSAFIGNKATYHGGSHCIEQSGIGLLNCTCINNTAAGGGAIALLDNTGTSYVYNTILWNNESINSDQIFMQGDHRLDIGHSIVQGGMKGMMGGSEPSVSNLKTEDPLFIYSGDIHLKQNSPCIDTGSTTTYETLYDNQLDIDGKPRKIEGKEGNGSKIDIGASEFNANADQPIIALSKANYSFITQAGLNPFPEVLNILNCGGGVLNWNVAIYGNDTDWLNNYFHPEDLLPNSGSTVAVDADTVLANRNLEPGMYACLLKFYNEDPNNDAFVGVRLNVGRERLAGNSSALAQYISEWNAGDIIYLTSPSYVIDQSIKIDGKNVVLKASEDLGGCQVVFENNHYLDIQHVDRECLIQGITFVGGATVTISPLKICEAMPTIRDCYFVDCKTIGNGGSIFCEKSSPKIENCHFLNVDYDGDNAENGGAIYNKGSSPIIVGCEFNQVRVSDSTGQGGGIYNDQDSIPSIINCIFMNSVAWQAGAIYFEQSGTNDNRVTVDGCQFVRNKAEACGGAIYAFNSAIKIINCLFECNAANDPGGAIYATGEDVIVSNVDFQVLASKFYANYSKQSGGAIYAVRLKPQFKNDVFVGNISDELGGAITFNNIVDESANYEGIALANSSFTQNTGKHDGAVVFFSCGLSAIAPNVINSIFYENSTIPSTTEHWSVQAMLIDDVLPKAYNFIEDQNREDPEFVLNPDCTKASSETITVSSWKDLNDKDITVPAEKYDQVFGDLRLKVSSCCIDSGKSLAELYTDIRGSVRPLNIKTSLDISGFPGVSLEDNSLTNGFDIGAYEYSDYFSGIEDGIVKPFIWKADIPSAIMVGQPVELKWYAHNAFPDDRRIVLPGQYEVNIVLVSDDGATRKQLASVLINDFIAPEGYYKTEVVFDEFTIGNWKIRFELGRDADLFGQSQQSYDIMLQQPELVIIGHAVIPPFDANASEEPEVPDEFKTRFFWSDYSRKLYAVGPATTVITWAGNDGNQYPQLITNRWPDPDNAGEYTQIHIANTPPVNLLPEDGGYGYTDDEEEDNNGDKPVYVEIKFCDNDAHLDGDSGFTASQAGYAVLMYGEDSYYDCEPHFEIVQTKLWNDIQFSKPVQYAIGDEITDLGHNANCGDGFVFFEISPYDIELYDRNARRGQIIPVNLDNPYVTNDNLVIVWYNKGLYGADWPYKSVRYDLEWNTDEKIVIASQLGSEYIDVNGVKQTALAGTYKTVKIYNQPDRTKAGFNPNEEHSLLLNSTSGAGSKVVYALRNDLNQTDWSQSQKYTSEPYVLVKGQINDDTWEYRVFKVWQDDDLYTLNYLSVAGELLEPPYPMNKLLPLCDSMSFYDPAGPWWQDYTGKIWAKNGGLGSKTYATGSIFWYYPLQAGFYYDLDNDGHQDEIVGTPIPWLHRSTGKIEATEFPLPVFYQVGWPTGVPALQIGETLFESKNGLPDIMNQTSVDIIFDQARDDYRNGQLVRLIDPLSERRVSLGKLPDSLLSKVEKVGTIQVFTELPYPIRKRFFYDTLGKALVFKGDYDDSGLGDPFALLNIMNPVELSEIKAMEGADTEFCNAVDSLYSLTRAQLQDDNNSFFGQSKALTAGAAAGTGYVTLAMQSHPDCEPLPVSLEVIKVNSSLYRGRIEIIESDNVFDERLTMRHIGDFGGEPEKVQFEWKYSYSPDEPDPLSSQGWSIYIPPDGADLADIDITIGSAGLLATQDIWFTCRYKGYSSVFGNNKYSMWTEPQLHESWVKRVMKKINLFDQRYVDFRLNRVNTYSDMISQTGARYEGPVALVDDPEHLNDSGMIELYQTIYNRALDFSLDQASIQKVDYNAARTIQFAASRIADLYMLLGNEAYADAEDPTVGFSAENQAYNVMAPGIFCFQNQVSSLLDEELALLRGISGWGSGDHVYEKPLYNRLMWNFTLGTGEVAYALTYNITDLDDNDDSDLDGNRDEGDGDIDEYDAKKMYPQGHGDAWGHYLTASKIYYDLLRNKKYTWVPQAENIVVNGTPVRVDYYDERKFASVAAAKARCGAEIVDLTYRQKFSEDPEKQWKGYPDSDSNRSWGVEQWACRAGQGAYFDWLTSNTMLPYHDPNQLHEGLEKVDRTTVVENDTIANAFLDIQKKLDRANSGLTPAGIARDAVPFDINPYELIDAQGQPTGRTHFEQIYDRAIQALNNAIVAFNYANRNTQLLRTQQDSVEKFQQSVEDRERDFNSRLIEIFGYPYRDDIGSGRTYSAGYDGPDVYHFDYVDSSELMQAAPVEVQEFKTTFKEVMVDADGVLSEEPVEVVFHISADGLGLIKPESWTGKRRAKGEIQQTRSDLLQARARFDKTLLDYNNLIVQIESQAEMLQAQKQVNAEEVQILYDVLDHQISLNDAIRDSRENQQMFRTISKKITLVSSALAEAFPTSTGFSIDVTSVIRSAIRLTGSLVANIYDEKADDESINELSTQQTKEIVQSQSSIDITTLKNDFAIQQQLEQLKQQIRAEASMRLELLTLAESMQQISDRYSSALARGQRLLEDRLVFRKQTANNVQDYRYKDMAFRIFRSDALQKYRAQFDMAAQYVYLAAKAYDYDTAFLDVHDGAGQEFMENILKQRTIGTIENGTPLPGDGLAGVLAQMKQNYDVLKYMMGFNNPQIETTWFSLRKENFLLSMSSNDNVDWKTLLDKCYVSNLWDMPEYKRYCKPFTTEDEVLPALVIPFQTCIATGWNFFGKEGKADPYYAQENFVTKIRSVGIWFSNYDTTLMSPTPRVYLIPVGEDRVWADVGQTRSWQVIDQVIPVPYPITETELENSMQWLPMLDTTLEPFADIRRYSRFRAYPDGGFNPDEMAYDSRLIGRSVWNTKWLLIIPGHSLYLSDPALGLESFIQGYDWDGDGIGNGVTDIKLFFKTYAYPGY